VPSAVFEAECLATTKLSDGNEMALIMHGGESVISSLHHSSGILVRGKFYRVTFEEIPPPITAMSP
jgi:hypothetical protein